VRSWSTPKPGSWRESKHLDNRFTERGTRAGALPPLFPLCDRVHRSFDCHSSPTGSCGSSPRTWTSLPTTRLRPRVGRSGLFGRWQRFRQGRLRRSLASIGVEHGRRLSAPFQGIFPRGVSAGRGALRPTFSLVVPAGLLFVCPRFQQLLDEL